MARDYLVSSGYGVVAIDCLGYNGTSKPLDKESYSLQLISQDIKEIVDKQGLDKVVSLGHDWVSDALLFPQTDVKFTLSVTGRRRRPALLQLPRRPRVGPCPPERILTNTAPLTTLQPRRSDRNDHQPVRLRRLLVLEAVRGPGRPAGARRAPRLHVRRRARRARDLARHDVQA